MIAQLLLVLASLLVFSAHAAERLHELRPTPATSQATGATLVSRTAASTTRR